MPSRTARTVTAHQHTERARSLRAQAVLTAAFAALLLSANLATPLYAVWARQFGFSTAVLGLVFAVYALVLVPALLLFGQLSDRLGRRPVIGLGVPASRRAELRFRGSAPGSRVAPFGYRGQSGRIDRHAGSGCG